MKRPNFNSNNNSVTKDEGQLLNSGVNIDKKVSFEENDKNSKTVNNIKNIKEEDKTRLSKPSSRLKFLRKLGKKNDSLDNKNYNASVQSDLENLEEENISKKNAPKILKNNFLRNIRKIDTNSGNKNENSGFERLPNNKRNRSRKKQNTFSSPIKNSTSRKFMGFKNTSFKISQKGSSNIMLTLVAVLLISGACLVFMAPTIKAWIAQSQEYTRLENQIAQTQKINDELRNKLKELNEDSYVADQARQRLGYVKQGETTYVVVDPETVTSEKAEDEGNQIQPRKPWFNLIQDSIKAIEERKDFNLKNTVEKSENKTPNNGR